tara:strand:+ start:1124 stop:1660 length:537 start_codon:yes stop_codon:yes gene_type:complete
MRKLMLLLIPISLGLGGTETHEFEPIVTLDVTPIEIEVVEPTFVKPTYTLDVEPLIQAMIMVESEGNDSAYHKREKAAGCLQIRPIMVREVNRILTIQKSELEYTLEDRWSREKSIEMFHIVNGYHNKNSTYEEIARAWNGGPKWIKKSLTKRYWKRVQKQLKKQKKDERSNTEFAEV